MADYRTEVLADSPLVYYHLDETGTPTVIVDSSGHGSDGSAPASPNKPTFEAVAPNSYLGTAVTFDGTNDYLESPDLGTGVKATTFTVEAWIKTTVANTYMAIASPRNATGTGWWFGLYGDAVGRPLEGIVPGPGGAGLFSIAASAAGVPSGTWSHVAMVVDFGAASKIKLFLNGSEVSSYAYKDSAFGYGPMTQQIIRIGETREGSHPWNGQIDEFAFYTTALSAARISTHYSSAGTAPFIATATSFLIAFPEVPTIKADASLAFIMDSGLTKAEDSFLVSGSYVQDLGDTPLGVSTPDTPDVNISDYGETPFVLLGFATTDSVVASGDATFDLAPTAREDTLNRSGDDTISFGVSEAHGLFADLETSMIVQPSQTSAWAGYILEDTARLLPSAADGSGLYNLGPVRLNFDPYLQVIVTTGGEPQPPGTGGGGGGGSTGGAGSDSGGGGGGPGSETGDATQRQSDPWQSPYYYLGYAPEFPLITTQIAFDQEGPMQWPPPWVDAGAAREVRVHRGRSFELDRYEAGTAVVRLPTRDGFLDPTNPLVGGAFNQYFLNKLIPMLQIRVLAHYAGIVEPLFTGFIEDWAIKRNGPRDLEVELSCVDGFEVLNAAQINKYYAPQHVDDRIRAALEDAGWKAGTDSDVRIELGTGRTSVQGVDYGDDRGNKVPILSVIGDAVDAEMGQFFISARGHAVFYGRRHRTRVGSRVESIFGDNADLKRNPEHFPIKEVTLNYSKDEIRNFVTVTPTLPPGSDASGFTPQHWSDGAAVKRFGLRNWDANDLIIDRTREKGYTFTAKQVANWLARWILWIYKRPDYRASQLVLHPIMRVDMWRHIFERELGDLIAIRTTDPGGGGIQYPYNEFYIESIDHHIEAPFTWETTYELSPAARWRDFPYSPRAAALGLTSLEGAGGGGEDTDVTWYEAVSASNPAMWWPLDDPAGTDLRADARDIKGQRTLPYFSSVDPPIPESITWGVAGPLTGGQEPNRAPALLGASWGSAPPINRHTDLSIEGWIWSDWYWDHVLTSDQRKEFFQPILCDGNPLYGTSGYGFGVRADGFLGLFVNGLELSARSEQHLGGTNAWYHVVAVCSPAGLWTLYVNGAAQSYTDSETPATANSDRHLCIGTDHTLTTGFAGKLYGIAWYARTLSVGEIMQHYLSGAHYAANSAG